MGMALDELNKKQHKYFTENDIDVIIDERLDTYYGLPSELTVDYINTEYGSGFVINQGAGSGSC